MWFVMLGQEKFTIYKMLIWKCTAKKVFSNHKLCVVMTQNKKINTYKLVCVVLGYLILFYLGASCIVNNMVHPLPIQAVYFVIAACIPFIMISDNTYIKTLIFSMFSLALIGLIIAILQLLGIILIASPGQIPNLLL